MSLRRVQCDLPRRSRRAASIPQAERRLPATVRGRKAQKLSPSRELAGSSGGGDADVVAAVVLDEEVAVAGLRQGDPAQPALELARLWPSSWAVLIAIPPTTPTVSARPRLSRTERSPLDQSQQAKTRPAYWIGMKT